MVLCSDLIRSKQEFHVAWFIGTGEAKSLSRKQILEQKLPDLCNSIIAIVPERDRATREKATLVTLSRLAHGTVLIHQVQVDHLQKEVKELKERMKKKSFVMLLGEIFDREQLQREREQMAEENNERLQPIARIEDVDDMVDLANLQAISEMIGINGDPRDFTMQDAVPNLSQWGDGSVDFTGIYGQVQPFYFSQQNLTMHSTFIEGNGSDERERRADAVVHDFGDFVAPHDTRKLRSAVIREPEFDQQDTFRFEEPRNKSPTENLQFSQCILVELQENRDQPNPPHEPDYAPPPSPRKEPSPNPDHTLQPLNTDKTAPPLADNTLPLEQQPTEEPLQPLPAQLEDIDLVDVPPGQQEQLAEYVRSIVALPAGDMNLPPLPNDLDLLDDQIPPPKRPRLDEEQEEIGDVERARLRPSSRPLTPVNQTELTELHSTIRVDEPEFQIDSQIRDVLPQRKRSRRNLPIVYGDDLEIDAAVQKVLYADYSSLVKKKKDVLINIDSVRDNALELLEHPEPMFMLGRRMPEDFRRMFRSVSYESVSGEPVSEVPSREQLEEEKEPDPEKFATICLRSPIYVAPQEELQEQQPQREFVEEYMPPQQETLTNLLTETGDIEMVQPRIENRIPTPDQSLKFASASLLATPERRRETAIADVLDLDPLPIAGNLASYDFTNPINRTMDPLERSENLEHVRQRHKSSLGVRHQRTEVLDEDIFEHGRKKREKQLEEHRRQAEKIKGVDEDLFFFSSGSLLPDNRCLIHQELLNEALMKYPEWVDFTEFTTGFTCKKAATAFDGLLLSLKNLKVCAMQDEPYGPILVQHIVQDEL